MRRKYSCLLWLPLAWSVSIRHAEAQTAPEARAAAQAAQAIREEAEAEATLPPLEIMLDVWGVPFERPYAFRDADMIRVGVEQMLPAPGERTNLRRAAALRGQSLVAEGEARSRALAIRKAHALIEQDAALRSHRVHLTHLALSERALELARARHAAGASLADVSMAEVETARASALVTADEARAQKSRAMLVALQDAPPVHPTTERPELAALRLNRDAELADAEAARARSSWPDPRIGASYFAPSAGMSEHAFGISLGMSLPWLWGSRTSTEQAAKSRARALTEELAIKRRDVELERVEAQGEVVAARAALSALKERVLPATERARQLALAAYESGQGTLGDVLRSDAQHVETEMRIVEVESELAHRLADLDFARGSVSSNTADREKIHAE